MRSLLVVENVWLLPGDQIAVRCTVIEGPRVETGAQGRSLAQDSELLIRVAGVAVSNPFLVPSSQGLLIVVVAGDSSELMGSTFEFLPPGA